MKKNFVSAMLAAVLGVSMLAGCGGVTTSTSTTAAPMTGTPVPSTTVPLIALFWADTEYPPERTARNTRIPAVLSSFLNMLVNGLMVRKIRKIRVSLWQCPQLNADRSIGYFVLVPLFAKLLKKLPEQYKTSCKRFQN